MTDQSAPVDGFSGAQGFSILYDRNGVRSYSFNSPDSFVLDVRGRNQEDIHVLGRGGLQQARALARTLLANDQVAKIVNLYNSEYVSRMHDPMDLRAPRTTVGFRLK